MLIDEASGVIDYTGSYPSSPNPKSGVIKVLSDIKAGAPDAAVVLDTKNQINATDRLISFRNKGVEKLAVMGDGSLNPPLGGDSAFLTTTVVNSVIPNNSTPTTICSLSLAAGSYTIFANGEVASTGEASTISPFFRISGSISGVIANQKVRIVNNGGDIAIYVAVAFGSPETVVFDSVNSSGTSATVNTARLFAVTVASITGS